MKSIFNYTEEELAVSLVANNFKKFNATQIFEWIYKKHEYNVDNMSNLSKDLKTYLKQYYSFDLLKCLEKKKSSNTTKYLFEVEGDFIECVLMRQKYGESLCISSEVGCPMGCAFCESGRLKKVRDLSVSELVLQILSVEKEENIRIDNVVIMGIGEPFDNFDNIVKFLDILTSPKGITIAQRKITVSTCGLVPKIYDFASLDNQVNLAVSLHAPNDEIRNEIMPINKVYPIKDLMRAVDEYIRITNRRVTIEYIMLDDINDSIGCAYELCKLLKGKLVYVNLIPYNKTNANLTFKRSKDFKIKGFYDILKKNNIEVIIRKEMGSSSNAACGQLRASKKKV